MASQHLTLIFFGGLLPLLYLAFVLGRNKAGRLRAQGAKMHSQPDQYGWYTVVYTGLPAITVATAGGFLYLLDWELIPPTLLISASLAIGAVGA